MRKTVIIMGILVLLAVLAMPTASAQNVTYYLTPVNNSVPDCTSTEVEIRVDTHGLAYAGGQIGLTYDTSCANVTNFEFGPVWTIDGMKSWNAPGWSKCWDRDGVGTDTDWLIFGVMWDLGPGGDVLIGTFTINCSNPGGDCNYCTTGLNMTCGVDCSACPIATGDPLGNPVPFNLSENGTFTCCTPAPDLVVTAIDAYHYDIYTDAWFNLTNEIDVTVKNIGELTADESNVCLYIDDIFFGKLPVPGLDAGASATVTFENWMPVGEDCMQPPCVFEWSSEDYNLTAVADCDNDVAEGNEMNNETTVVDTACYNGYTGDEPLENVVHGVLHGGMLFTTGDGLYNGLYSVGAYRDTHYDIELPAGASVELAHLNVYYTWNKPLGTCPEMEVNITTPGGTTYTLPLMTAYNDIKCEAASSMWVLPWGNYVYDLTDHITENGTYTVRVKNVCTACQNFCPAAPGIVLVYEDANAPMIEYWINEGADELIGGRRSDGGSLAWWECINNATFPASTKTGVVVNATLGVVSPWGGSSWQSGMTNYLFFNGVKLGTGVYHGYNNPCSYTIDSLSMEIGGSNAQVGINATSVTDHYLKGSDNTVGQADDGDCMMPANAFLVVEYEDVPGTCGDVTDNTVVNTGDVILLSNYVGYTGYTLQNEWAGDVTGNGVINTGDVILLSNFVGYTGYSLNCT